MNIRVTALAEFDIQQGQEFYARQGEWVLNHFMNCMRRSIGSLADYAGIHPKKFGYYKARVDKFPFSIYYDIEDGEVVVHAVLDDRFGPARIVAHFGPEWDDNI